MTSRKLLLHIGTGKTGSTAIQESLFSTQMTGFCTNKIYYPFLLGKHHHNELCCLVMPHQRIRRDIKSIYTYDNERYRSYVSQLKNKFYEELKDKNNVVISGEYFCGFNQSEVSDFITIFRGMGFDDIKAVVYFREPVSLYLSQIQQRLKASSKFASPKNFYFDYKGIVERWKSEVESIDVREFSRSKLINQDIVDDFSDAIRSRFSIDLNISSEFKNSENESLSASSMAIMQDFRTQYYSGHDNVFDERTKRLINLLSQAELDLNLTRKPVLKDDVENIILNRHIEQLAYLTSTYGITQTLKPLKSDLVTRKFGHITDVVDFDEADREAYRKLLLYVVNQLAGLT